MTRKLDAKHLEDIQTLKERYAEISNAIGNLSIEKYFLQEKLAELDQELDQAFVEFKRTQEQETQLVDEMRARYGEGQINTADGTFTPSTGLNA